MPNNDEANTKVATLTIENYLRGKVATDIPDKTLLSIEAEVGVDPNSAYADLSERQRDLCLAGMYVYLSTNPSQTQKITEKDADWEHSEGGQIYSANALSTFLRMANAIYKKYDFPTVGCNKWGMSGGGFCNIRNYGNPLMR